jgi:hypothetical protein
MEHNQMQLDPINQLLCNCLGSLSDVELAIILASVSSEEWEALILLSQNHRVSSQCYKRLKNPALSNCLPPHILEELKKNYLHTAYTNTLILNGLEKVLQAFNQGDIPVIPLKGIHLAENIYKNIALRVMGDVDLLVQKKDLEQIQRQLITLGYTSRPYWLESEHDLLHSLPPFSKPNAADLDVHWDFENPDSPFKVDNDGLWQRAIPVKVAGVDVLSLSPEDFLLHLCMHTSYHHRFESGLRSLCDLSATLITYQSFLDWPLFLVRTHEWGVERCVFLSLHLAQLLVGAKVPTGLLDKIKPTNFDSRIEIFALEQIFPKIIKRQNVSVNIAKTLRQHSFKERIAMFIRFVFLSRSLMSMRYHLAPNSVKLIFCYPHRWFYLVTRYGYSIWKLIIGNKNAQKINQRDMNALELAEWLSKPDPIISKIGFHLPNF